MTALCAKAPPHLVMCLHFWSFLCFFLLLQKRESETKRGKVRYMNYLYRTLYPPVKNALQGHIDPHRQKPVRAVHAPSPPKTGDMFQPLKGYLSHLADSGKEVIHDAPTMARLRSPTRLPLNGCSQRHAPLETGQTLLSPPRS